MNVLQRPRRGLRGPVTSAQTWTPRLASTVNPPASVDDCPARVDHDVVGASRRAGEVERGAEADAARARRDVRPGDGAPGADEPDRGALAEGLPVDGRRDDADVGAARRGDAGHGERRRRRAVVERDRGRRRRARRGRPAAEQAQRDGFVALGERVAQRKDGDARLALAGRDADRRAREVGHEVVEAPRRPLEGDRDGEEAARRGGRRRADDEDDGRAVLGRLRGQRLDGDRRHNADLHGRGAVDLDGEREPLRRALDLDAAELTCDRGRVVDLRQDREHVADGRRVARPHAHDERPSEADPGATAETKVHEVACAARPHVDDEAAVGERR